MKALLLMMGLLLLLGCDSNKSPREATDDALEAVLRYKKLKAEGKLPTPEEEAELRRRLQARVDQMFAEWQARVKTVVAQCSEIYPDNPDAYKLCLQKREPVLFSDGKARDDCIMGGKTSCP